MVMITLLSIIFSIANSRKNTLFRLIAFSWALRWAGGWGDYFLVLTDSACFHICLGFGSNLSDVDCIKHIEELPQIFSVSVRKHSMGVG